VDKAAASPGPDRFRFELGGDYWPMAYRTAGRRRPDARGARSDHRAPQMAMAGGDRRGIEVLGFAGAPFSPAVSRQRRPSCCNTQSQ
jgi:hypothetical protein